MLIFVFYKYDVIMRQLFVTIMFIIAEADIMCFSQPLYNVRHYKSKRFEISVNKTNTVAKKAIADCVIYIVNRNSCEITTCDIIRVDKKTKREYRIGVSSSINGNMPILKEIR